MKKEEMSPFDFGWSGPVTEEISAIVQELNEHGIQQSLLSFAQFKAICWLHEMRPGYAIILPTHRGERLFVLLANIRILLATGVPSSGDLIAARKGLADMLQHSQLARTTLNEVPDSVKRFNFTETVVSPLDATISGLQHRISLIDKEIEQVNLIANSVSGAQNRPPEWFPRSMLRCACKVFFNTTGFQPARRLPVRSFQGFLERFCEDVEAMKKTNWPRLSSEGIDNPDYWSEFVPFESEAEKNAAIRFFPKGNWTDVG